MPPPPPAPEPDDDAPTEVTAPGPAESGAVIPGQRSETRRGAPDDARAREAPVRDTPVSDTPAPARPVATDTDVSDESPETAPRVPRARRTPAKKTAKATPAGSGPAKPDEPERPAAEPAAGELERSVAKPLAAEPERSVAEPAAEHASDQPADASPATGTVPPDAEAGTARTQGAEPGTAGTRVAKTGTVWDRLLADPAHAPELLALAAVERLGPEAARYTAWIRATYPGATDDRLAQAAGRRFAASARHGALAGSMLTGAAVPGVVRAAVLGWQQARLVLHVAAAYGQDPCAPERAAELLVLLRMHGDLPGARDALATARQTGVPPRRPARPVLSAGLLSTGLLGAGRRLLTRLVPGAGVLVDVLVNDAVMEGLARRAIGLYRSGKLRAPATVSAAGARQGGTAGVTTD